MAFLDETAGGFVAPGPPGASAYEVWRGQGNTGTLDDFFAAQKGEKGDASTVPGPPGIQGPPGLGTVLTRTATTDIPASTWVVESGNNTCSIADPANMTQRGKVLGIVATATLANGTATISSIGPATGISGSFGPGDPLYIGDGAAGRRLGSVVSTPPAALANADVWRQRVGTATTAGVIVINLGPALRVPPTSATALVGPSGGYAATTALTKSLLGLADAPSIRDLIEAVGSDDLSQDYYLPNALPTSRKGTWPNIDGQARIWKFRDRILAGGAASHNGDFNNDNGTWCPNLAYGPAWAVAQSQFLFMSDRGTIAVCGMSQSKDNTDYLGNPLGQAIGLAGLVIANKAGRDTWALYGDVQHETNDGVSFGLELAIKNKAANQKSTPFNATSPKPVGPVGIWAAAGGDSAYGGAPISPSNFAMGIFGHNQTWNTGLLFCLGGLTLDGNGLGDAIHMVPGHRLLWSTSGTAGVAQIYLDPAAPASAQPVSQRFGSGRVDFIVGSNTKLIVSDGGVGFNGNGAQGKQTLPAALPTDGSASNATRDALLNALRASGIAFGLNA